MDFYDTAQSQGHDIVTFLSPCHKQWQEIQYFHSDIPLAEFYIQFYIHIVTKLGKY